MNWSTVLVIAKQPVPGRVKTRLVPPFDHAQAAELAGAALRDTLRAAGEVPASRRVLVFAGDPEGWLPRGWATAPQAAGGLDLRLADAFATAARLDPGPAVLVGMDTPQFTAADLPPLGAFDACLGLAEDGGFWAIGFRDPLAAAAVLPGVPMSTAVTGAVQLSRLASAGLRVRLLDALVDVDDAASARAVAAAAPWTEFARTFDAMAADARGVA